MLDGPEHRSHESGARWEQRLARTDTAQSAGMVDTRNLETDGHDQAWAWFRLKIAERYTLEAAGIYHCTHESTLIVEHDVLAKDRTLARRL